MRILKYIFLILILLSIGTFVFVSTQKSDYNVTKTVFIKTSKPTVYNFVNNYENWADFASWLSNNDSNKISFSKLSEGKNASFSWENNSDEGNLKTFFAKENDSIFQKMENNGEDSTLSWKFSTTTKGTKVTLKTKGKLDFKSKIASFFSGGVTTSVENNLEKSLNNLNKILDYEMNRFSIKVNGVVDRNGGFYVSNTTESNEKDVAKNIKTNLNKVENYFAKNSIVMSGKPFVLYSKYDKTNDIIDFSTGIGVKDSVIVSEKSGFKFDLIKPYSAVKTTLMGDHSHTQEAWTKGYDYMLENKIYRNEYEPIIEVYTKSKEDIKNPSKWITEIYIPIYKKTSSIKTAYHKLHSKAISAPATSVVAPTPTPVPSTNEDPEVH